jgi:hypothetical protein
LRAGTTAVVGVGVDVGAVVPDGVALAEGLESSAPVAREAALSSSAGVVAMATMTRSAAAADTTALAATGVPRRNQRPTRPIGRHKASPGTITHQVCHHAGAPEGFAIGIAGKPYAPAELNADGCV